MTRASCLFLVLILYSREIADTFENGAADDGSETGNDDVDISDLRKMLEDLATLEDTQQDQRQVPYESVGCFKDNPRDLQPLLPELLADLTSVIDWNDVNTVIHKCAELASAKGYLYFGLQALGQCRSGKDGEITLDDAQSSSGCIRGLGSNAESSVYKIVLPQDAVDGCYNHTVLSCKDRAMTFSNQSVLKCDQDLSPGWYRYMGDAGTQMPTSCVPTHHCGTRAPGWLNGQHPGVSEGEVVRRVCFHWSSGCCAWHVDVKVKNCDGFYAYKFETFPDVCEFRFCGNGRALSTTESPTTPTEQSTTLVPTTKAITTAEKTTTSATTTKGTTTTEKTTTFAPTTKETTTTALTTPAPTTQAPSLPIECQSYTELTSVNRSVNFNTSVTSCDDKLQRGWYRFTENAGNMMPTSCVTKKHCGAHAPGWLMGGHPAVHDGTVNRDVCFSWRSCCSWRVSVLIRNCGSYFVYYLPPTSTCNLRYCGNGQAPTTHRPTPKGSTTAAPATQLPPTTTKPPTTTTKPPTTSCTTKPPTTTTRPPTTTTKPTKTTTKPPTTIIEPPTTTTRPPTTTTRSPTTTEKPPTTTEKPPTTSKEQTTSIPTTKETTTGPTTSAQTTQFPTTARPLTTVQGDECALYATLSSSDRNINFKDDSNLKCDRSLEGWYRFQGAAGTQMPTTCVPSLRCSAHASGWLEGRHPTAREGIVNRSVCFSWKKGCCTYKTAIQVRNCSGFYVYRLSKPPLCYLRYCSTSGSVPIPTPAPSPECSSYSYLDSADRSIDFKISRKLAKCDRNLVPGWYRLSGAAGKQMPTSCVDTDHCGTHAPGWLSGDHPSVGEAVRVKVCFHWMSNCCRWSTYVRVLNCSGFYLYEFKPPPVCRLRYCGDGKTVSATTPGLTTMRTPSTAPSIRPTTSPGRECLRYRVLNTFDRSQMYEFDLEPSGGRAVCDRSLRKTWYRFKGLAGDRMPNWCVPTRRCGTHAPGWLQGRHPSVLEGVVSRKVCFNWGNNCCRWSTNISVRNCGYFYVYKLDKPPKCRLRYCGTGPNDNTALPTTKPLSPTVPNHGFLITCVPAGMHVQIPRKLLPQFLDPSLLHLEDPSCGVTRMDDNNVALTTPLDSCGTTRRTTDGEMSFHNKVVAEDGLGQKRSVLFEFPFKCTYRQFNLPGAGIKQRFKPLNVRGQAMDTTSTLEQEAEELSQNTR